MNDDVALDINPELAASLVYDGRARKRPPGASALVQRIYGLLLEHPEGTTISEIHEHFRDGWLETDAYRAYEKKLILEANRNASKINRNHDERYPKTKSSEQLRLDDNYSTSTNSPKHKRQRSRRRIPTYGTPEFEENAQRWWIQIRLKSMKQSGTARREGTRKNSRWYAGNRAPRVIIACEGTPKGYHVRPINVAHAKALAQADTAAHVRREEVKAALLEALNDKRFKGRGRELAQLAYNYLIGH